MAGRDGRVYDQGLILEFLRMYVGSARHLGNETGSWGLDWPPDYVPWPGAYCSLRTRELVIPQFRRREPDEEWR